MIISLTKKILTGIIFHNAKNIRKQLVKFFNKRSKKNTKRNNH